MTVPEVYFWDGWQTVEETDSSGNLKRQYVWGEGIDECLKATVPDAANLVAGDEIDLYYHHNSLGSVVAVTKADGTVVESYRYSAFGKPTILNGSNVEIATTAVEQPFMFTGARYDFEEGSGLYQMRMRYYDPVVGRFVSRDPLGLWGDPSQKGNGQAYCSHDPINLADPAGTTSVVHDIGWAASDGGGGGGTGQYSAADLQAMSQTDPRRAETIRNEATLAGQRALGTPEPPTAADVGQAALDFTRGVGDTISFGLTEKAREAIYGEDGEVVYEGAHLAGAVTTLAVETLISGGSAAMVQAAGRATRAAGAGATTAKGVRAAIKAVKDRLRREARRATGAVTGSGREAHHLFPLTGHPLVFGGGLFSIMSGARSYFPSFGMPWVNALWNLRLLSRESHMWHHFSFFLSERLLAWGTWEYLTYLRVYLTFQRYETGAPAGGSCPVSGGAPSVGMTVVRSGGMSSGNEPN